MNGNCHFIYGASTGIAIAMNVDKVATVLPAITNTPETATLFILGGLLGGIFPDIDNPTSYMGKLSAPVSTVIGFINEHQGKTNANHRGILHDPIVYIAGLILSYFFMTPLVGFFIGCLSHIFLDMFNPKGVPFLFFKRISLAKLKSGEIGSIIFTWICLVVTLSIGFVFKFFIG